MSLAAEHDQSAAIADGPAKPVVNISVITPKPGKFEEFMAMQLAQQQSLRGEVQGLLGARTYRSRDDSAIVIVAVFETAADSERWREDERLLAHRARTLPLIERAAPGTFETAYAVGAI